MADTPPDTSGMTEAVIQNAFKLWFFPEYERRVAAGTLPAGHKLFAAQVIIQMDRPPEIHFDTEIRGVLSAEVAKLDGIKKGDVVRSNDLGDIKSLSLTEEYADSGHLTVIYHRSHWYLLFDFRYNARRIRRTLAVAHQFLALAETAMSRNFPNAFVENLFASVELLARSFLLMHNARLLHSSSHGFVQTQFNLWGKLKNVSTAHVEVFNRLTALRKDSRYSLDAPALSVSEMETLLSQAKGMVTDLERVRPRRWGEDASLSGEAKAGTP